MNRRKKLWLCSIILIVLFSFNSKVKADNNYCYYKGTHLKNNILTRITKSSGKVEFYDMDVKKVVSTATGRNDKKTYDLSYQYADLNVKGSCPNYLYAIYYVKPDVPTDFENPYEVNASANCIDADDSYTCYPAYAFGGNMPKKFRELKDQLVHTKYTEMLSYINYPKETKTQGEKAAEEIIKSLTITPVKDNKKTDKEIGKINCENMPRTFGFVKGFYNFIRFIIPTLIVVFSSIDFASVVLSGETDKMQKAKKNFITRLIVGIAILFIPIILESLLKLAGILESSDNLIDLACLR